MVFGQTGDHKIPAHTLWLQVAWNIEKEVLKKKGVGIWPLREGFWENFTRA